MSISLCLLVIQFLDKTQKLFKHLITPVFACGDTDSLLVVLLDLFECSVARLKISILYIQREHSTQQ
jgi:hypothetical protein